jgi:hypothetical protein
MMGIISKWREWGKKRFSQSPVSPVAKATKNWGKNFSTQAIGY